MAVCTERLPNTCAFRLHRQGGRPGPTRPPRSRRAGGLVVSRRKALQIETRPPPQPNSTLTIAQLTSPGFSGSSTSEPKGNKQIMSHSYLLPAFRIAPPWPPHPGRPQVEATWCPPPTPTQGRRGSLALQCCFQRPWRETEASSGHLVLLRFKRPVAEEGELGQAVLSASG